MIRDARLARRILEGDRDAGERWVVRSYPRVYRMLRALTGSSDVAEDLSQQTFVQAWQGLAGFRGDSRLDTWLHRIAYRAYTHWLRDRRETSSLDETLCPPGSGGADGLTTVLVSEALLRLGNELREAFLLYHVQQLSVREIAGLVETPEGTVKSRLFAARRRLRELLSESVDGAEQAAAHRVSG